MVMRTQIINKAIEWFDMYSYLEIGVGNNVNFTEVKAGHKNSCDINGKGIHTMKSDDFFETNDEYYDFIFVDGLHESEQVYNDIINSLGCLKEGGIIMCHDMSPKEEEHQERDSRQQEGEFKGFDRPIWNGDVWKAWIQLRREREDLEMYVINADYGCGIIRRGSQTLLKNDSELNFKNLDENRIEWLNLKEIEEIDWLREDEIDDFGEYLKIKHKEIEEKYKQWSKE